MKSSIYPKILLSLTAAALALGSGAAILYRGRLAQSPQGTTEFPAGAKYDMTFCVYGVAQGGEAFYRLATNGVPVGTDGGFEVLLDAPAIDAAVTNGQRRAYVGLALGGERELMPRREVLALPKVLSARLADSPGYRSHAERVRAGTVTASVCTVGEIEIAGSLTTTGKKDSVSVGKYVMKDGESLLATGRPVTVLGEKAEFIDCAKRAYACGEKLATMPYDGMAFVCLKSEGAATVGLSRTAFCRKGDAIVAPAAVGADQEVLVRVYSFATR